MVTFRHVSVIVPHRNDLAGLARCLDTLAGLPEKPHEIIVADNGPTAGLKAIITVIDRYLDLPIQLIHEPRQGAAHARNAGVKAANGQFLAFLDCDCRPDSKWLETGRKMLDNHAVVGGPVVVAWESRDGPMTAAVAFDLLFGFDVAKSFRRHRHLLTSNMWVRREAFDVVGPFREGVSEDVEWCHRAAAKGYELAFDRHLIVHHRALPSRQQLNARWRRITHETWLYWREGDGSRLTWFAKCCIVAASVTVHGARPIMDNRLIGCQLRMQTILLLAEIRLRRALYGFSCLFRSAETNSPPDKNSGINPIQ